MTRLTLTLALVLLALPLNAAPLDRPLVRFDAATLAAPPSADPTLRALDAVRLKLRAQAAEARPRLYSPSEAAADAPPDVSGMWANGPVGSYDILNNDVEILISPGNPEVTTFAETTLLVKAETLDELTFSYDAPLVQWVRSGDDTPLDFAQGSSGSLRVTPDHLLVAGDTYVVRLAGAGKIGCTQNMVMSCDFDPEITYLTYEKFFPGNTITSDPHTGVLTLDVPAGVVAGGTGTLTLVTEQGDYVAYRREHVVPTELYSFALARYELTSGQAAGVPITVYSLPEHKAHAEDMLPLVDDVLARYGQTFIPFPWGKIDVVEIGNSFGGGYGPLSTIMLLSWAFQASLSGGHGMVSELISHELAHQWWGNLIGIWSADSIVLSEGLAEFSSALYNQWTTGARGQYVQNALIYTYGVSPDQDLPITYYGLQMSEVYQPVMYQKGSFLFDMLRWELGDEDFFPAMEAFVDGFAWQYGTIGELMLTVEQACGQDLGWFWKQWFYDTGLPHFKVAAQRTAPDELTLTIAQTQEDKVFSAHVPVRVVLADGSTQDERVWVDAASVTAKVALPQEPLLVSVDPERRLLRMVGLEDARDLNLDGDSNGLDVLRLGQGFNRNLVYGSGDEEFFFPDPRYAEFLDLNRDGKVNSDDTVTFTAAFEAQ